MPPHRANRVRRGRVQRAPASRDAASRRWWTRGRNLQGRARQGDSILITRVGSLPATAYSSTVADRTPRGRSAGHDSASVPSAPTRPSGPARDLPAAPSGRHQRASFGRRRTARDVTTSKAGTTRRSTSSARARSTVTFVRPSSSTTSSRNVVRRSNGSTKVTSRSGPRDRQHHTRAVRPRLPTSATGRPSGKCRRGSGAVEDVPVPQPGRLAGADQPTHHSISCQQVDKPIDH